MINSSRLLDPSSPSIVLLIKLINWSLTTFDKKKKEASWKLTLSLNDSAYLLYRWFAASSQTHEQDSRFAVGCGRAFLDVGLLILSVTKIFGEGVRHPVAVRQLFLVLNRHFDLNDGRFPPKFSPLPFQPLLTAPVFAPDGGTTNDHEYWIAMKIVCQYRPSFLETQSEIPHISLGFPLTLRPAS